MGACRAGSFVSEKDIPGFRFGILGLWVRVRGLREAGGLEQSNNGLRLGASGIGVRAKHRRSGDPGLWVRNKEQWADRGSEPPAPSCLCERTSCQDPNLRGSKDGSGWKRPVS